MKCSYEIFTLIINFTSYHNGSLNTLIYSITHVQQRIKAGTANTHLKSRSKSENKYYTNKSRSDLCSLVTELRKASSCNVRLVKDEIYVISSDRNTYFNVCSFKYIRRSLSSYYILFVYCNGKKNINLICKENASSLVEKRTDAVTDCV